jgi:hypothetical protein
MQYIAPGDNVLILPYGSFGNSNVWQAATGFYFRMAGGYLGQPPIPVGYLPYFPIVYDFYNLAESPFAGKMLKVFLVQKEVKEIVVAVRGAQLWKNNFKGGLRFPEPTQFDRDESLAIHSLFGTLGVAPIQTGGVSIYKVPLDRLAIYKSMDPNVLEARIVSSQLDTLFDAAAKYLAGGRSLQALNPVEIQNLGLLPPRWIAGSGIYNPHSPIQNGLVISATDNGDVLIGVVGARGTIEKLQEKYRAYAKAAEISSMMQAAAWVESSRWILLLECDREQLARAAEFARQNLSAVTHRPPTPDSDPTAPAASP